MQLTKQRETVFLDRYSLKDEAGVPTETVEQMWGRVAAGIADTPAEYSQFLNVLEDFKFVPGGRILAGAGSGTEVTFYNCYVLPVKNRSNPKNGNDSREAIFDTISEMVNIMSRGGGVGINWSTLRPNGAYLARINGTTTGPIEWMDVASKAVGAVMQGGSRRGAAMFMLDDWHPDVEQFINAKRDLLKITNANISVAVSDAFMQAVKDDADWDLKYPLTTDPAYNPEWDGDLAAWERMGHPVKVYKTVKARRLWRALAEGAWDNGEPGVIFLERYNNLSTAASIEKIISVNPCGEQGLGAYSVCNLGAMNLAAYVNEGKFDWDAFSGDIPTAVRFLDNVIDKNHYGDMQETEYIQKRLRRIGLSVMGLADALIMQRLRYGSEKAIEFTDDVFSQMSYAAIKASVELAKEKGAALGWSPSMMDRPYLEGYAVDSMEPREEMEAFGLRNLFLLTQAPTGTTSILAGVNSGIEPYFAFEYERNDRTGRHMVKAPVLERYIADGGDPENLPDFFVSANELTVEEHIKMQAAAQLWIDSSVSKTINAPNSHTVDEVVKAYTLAYDEGLKSVAYFRDGCGRDQVLTRDPKVETNGHFQRPFNLIGTTKRLGTSVGTAFVTVNKDESGRPMEVFVNVGKAGTDLSEISEAIGRLISIALQRGVRSGEISDQLYGVGGYGKMLRSLPTALAVALAGDGEPPRVEGQTDEACPECQSFTLLHSEGCLTCVNCGYSRC